MHAQARVQPAAPFDASATVAVRQALHAQIEACVAAPALGAGGAVPVRDALHTETRVDTTDLARGAVVVVLTALAQPLMAEVARRGLAGAIGVGATLDTLAGLTQTPRVRGAIGISDASDAAAAVRVAHEGLALRRRGAGLAAPTALVAQLGRALGVRRARSAAPFGADRLQRVSALRVGAALQAGARGPAYTRCALRV